MIPKHFLNKRSINQLIAYGIEAKENGHDAKKYSALYNSITMYNHEAFHTRLSLGTRKFFHCPSSSIPFSSCFVPSPKPKEI